MPRSRFERSRSRSSDVGYSSENIRRKKRRFDDDYERSTRYVDIVLIYACLWCVSEKCSV